MMHIVGTKSRLRACRSYLVLGTARRPEDHPTAQLSKGRNNLADKIEKEGVVGCANRVLGSRKANFASAGECRSEKAT